LKLNVFGKEVEVIRNNNSWVVYYCGNEGKKRIAHDIKLPANLPESDVVTYIDDLCHEWATPNNSEVKVLKSTVYETDSR